MLGKKKQTKKKKKIHYHRKSIQQEKKISFRISIFKKHVDVVLGNVVEWAVLVGGWLDWMILEIFSNVNDSKILFYDSVLSIPPLINLSYICELCLLCIQFC